MVLEARYLPTIDPEWLHLVNVEASQWEDYRVEYDLGASAAQLAVTSQEVRTYAEDLLLRAHRLDPTGAWSKLIRQAPRAAWKTLTGDALIALDHRLAAEVLLLFYEDLAVRRFAAPLPEKSGMAWRQLDDRLSAGRSEPIDALLAQLGVSPHPGVVLVVEGETEENLVPRVFDHLALRRTPDLIRIMCMRGADKDLSLVAAVSVAPLVGQRRGDSYEMIRPPTRLMITVDPDDNWNTDAKIARQRQKIIREIEKVVAAQGASVAPQRPVAVVTRASFLASAGSVGSGPTPLWGMDGYPRGTDFLIVRGRWTARVQRLKEIKMLYLFIIRRLNPRRRAIVGVSVTLVGLVLLGLAATVASWLLIHGIIAATVGIAFCIAAYLGRRKAQAAEGILVAAGDPC